MHLGRISNSSQGNTALFFYLKKAKVKQKALKTAPLYRPCISIIIPYMRLTIPLKALMREMDQ